MPSTEPPQPAALHMVTAPGIEALRAAIDRIDRAAADLLVRRARWARRVALLKLLAGRPNRDERREREVRDHYASVLKAAGWSDQSLDNWLETMLSASRDLQAHLSVAIQGAPGSWSDESLRACLPNLAIVHCDTVEEAWRRCKAGAVDAAWLAARNSTVGDVQATAAVRREAECWAEATRPVRHALIATPGTPLDQVTRIEAHPLAFAQCRATLERILPRAERIEAIDGAAAARRLHPGSATAVLASAQLAGELGLEVLREPMTDAADNATTFQLLVPKEIF